MGAGDFPLEAALFAEVEKTSWSLGVDPDCGAASDPGEMEDELLAGGFGSGVSTQTI